MAEAKELLLRDLYYSSAKNGTFLTQNQLYEKAKGEVTREEVKRFLESQKVYNKFKRMPGVQRYRKTKVYDLAKQLQIDLVIMTKYKSENDGYQYILVAVEILSRMAFAYPLKKRDGKDTRKGLEKVLQDFFDHFQRYPKVIQFDEGAEFKNKDVNQLLKKTGDIDHFWTKSKRQASIVERLNRTLQEKLRKLWELHGDKEWVSHLSDVIHSYNSQKHRAIGMSPLEVNEDNKFTVWGRLFGKSVDKVSRPKFKKNDLVRVYHFKLKHRATPGYRKYFNERYGRPPRTYMVEEKPIAPFSEEVFRIRAVKPLGEIVVYKLKSDAADENILGYFYEEELSAVR